MKLSESISDCILVFENGSRESESGSVGKEVVAKEALAELLPDSGEITLKRPAVAGSLGYRVVKRVFDVSASVISLVILAIPMAIVAVHIKLESSGPVIFSQTRVGLNGKPFKIYKFRSMYVGAEQDGARWAAKGDSRVTPLGRKLRDSRFDEVPQFVNVIRNEMSIIGPRPERPVFCEAFEKKIHGWNYRTLVRPGMSGLAQVVGGYEMLPDEKVALDLEYIGKRSIRLDLWIMSKTLGVIVKKRSVR